MSLLPIAFFMGFLGSLHCAVMCGPLVLGLPLKQKSNWFALMQVSLYQLGRILAYTVFGLIIGLIGNALGFYVKQEYVSIAIGCLLLLLFLLQITKTRFANLNKLQLWFMAPISKLMGKVFNLPFWGLFAGFLNGLIPCGMVYLALSAALNLQNTLAATQFMFWFGLGTTPLMFFISVGGIYLKKYFKFNTQKLMPWFVLVLGSLFILRSLNLSIPFISPVLHQNYGTAGWCF